MSTYKRFIIVTTGRTGSTWLVEALNSHDQIVCFGSLFEVGSEYVSFDVDGHDNLDAKARTLRDDDGVAFLNSYVFDGHNDSIRAVGFKFQYRNWIGFGKVLQALVEDHGLCVIHVRRENLLRSFVSLTLAKNTGRYHNRPMRRDWQRIARAIRHPVQAALQLRRRFGTHTYAPAKLTVSVEECRRFFMQTKMQEGSFDEQFAGHPRLDVTYEQLVDDFTITTDRILDFLSVQRRPLTFTQQPLNTAPLSEIIANYEELVAAFEGTPVERYLV